MFACSLGVEISLFHVVRWFSFEISPLVCVMVTKEFTDDLFSQNWPSVPSTDVYTNFDYI